MNTLKRNFFLLFFSFSSFFNFSLAQSREASLQDCLQQALENNLSIREGKLSVQKAQDLQGSAFELDRTNLSLSQDPTSGGGPDNGLSISQSFEFPTFYRARHRFLKAETAVERSNLSLTRNEIIRQVSGEYYSLVYLQRALDILARQDSVYRKFLFLAEAKSKAGETGRLELINAEKLCDENRMEREKTVLAFQKSSLALQQLTGSDSPVVPTEPLTPIKETEAPQNDLSYTDTPLAQMMEARTEAGLRSLALAKQGFLPGFSVGVTGQMLIKGFNPYNIDRERFKKGNFMGFEVGVSLPLFWGGQRAKVKAARRDVELARLGREQARLSATREYRNCLNEYYRAKKVLDYYERQGSQQADTLARIAQLSYEKGEIGYVEYIQNLKASFEIQLKQADAINEYNQTIVKLNYIKGNK